MRRDNGAASSAIKLVEDCTTEGGPIGGVGTSPQLVEQDQRARSCLGQNLPDSSHVRRECRERLLQALLVANVGQDVIEDRKLRAVAGRHVQARLRHDRQ